jgi:tRNA(fMet)-specific endonuclease VapC
MEGITQPDESRFVDQFRKVNLDEGIAIQASHIRKDLRERGQLIGDFDILIAATAVSLNEPLVTANQEHFSRVAGLECISYRR